MNINELIRGWLKSHKERDPDKIAPKILALIPDEQRTELLVDLLAEIVRDVERAERHKTLKKVRSLKKPRRSKTASAFKHRKKEIQTYDQLIAMTVAVKGLFRQAFGECTRSDIIALYDSHLEFSEQNQRQAMRYSAVVGLFDRYRNAKTVKDLPNRALLRAMKTGTTERALAKTA